MWCRRRCTWRLRLRLRLRRGLPGRDKIIVRLRSTGRGGLRRISLLRLRLRALLRLGGCGAITPVEDEHPVRPLRHARPAS